MHELLWSSISHTYFIRKCSKAFILSAFCSVIIQIPGVIAISIIILFLPICLLLAVELASLIVVISGNIVNILWYRCVSYGHVLLVGHACDDRIRILYFWLSEYTQNIQNRIMMNNKLLNIKPYAKRSIGSRYENKTFKLLTRPFKQLFRL